MLLTNIEDPIAIQAPECDTPSHALTPYSLTLILAYLHYYTPDKLPNGRFISPAHLRTLSHWIGQPNTSLLSVRQHPILAAHFALLHAAGFLSIVGSKIIPRPIIVPWLHASPSDQISHLLQAIASPSRWQASITDLGLQSALSLDYITYLQQSLLRQNVTPSNSANTAVWLDTESDEIWQLNLPPTLPLWLHFDLRQIGNWLPTQPLTCTPLTIARATQHGYGQNTIQWLLETATGQSLTTKQINQLQQWSHHAQAYRLRTVQLLTAAHPTYLEPILRRKEFRAATVEHLSPRHIIIQNNIIPTLEKWLASHNYPLAQHSPQSNQRKGEEDIAHFVGAAWTGTDKR
jgi:hypothetical protein